MMKILLLVLTIIALAALSVVAGHLKTAVLGTDTEPDRVATTTEPQACTMEALICPDGSAVGRTGPNCEFAACPSAEVSSDTVTTYLGGQVTRFNFTVNPREVVEDSRCPTDVTCIWAGAIKVRTAVSTQVGHGEHVFTLNDPRIVGDFTVTLIEVTPAPQSDVVIPEHQYRFTYKVEKN